MAAAGARLGRNGASRLMARRVAVMCVCLLATATYMRVATAPQAATASPQLGLLPGVIGDWRAKTTPLDPDVLAELKLDDYLNRQYRRGNNVPVTLYVGYHAGLRTANNVGPHSPLLCLPGLGWQLMDARQVAVSVPGAAPSEEQIVVTRSLARNGLDGLVVLFWYQVHGRVVPTEARTKLLLFGDALRGRGTAGALVRLIAPVDLLRTDSAAAGEREATAFLKAMYPLLRQRLAEQS